MRRRERIKGVRMKGMPEYRCWSAMKTRCLNTKDISYVHYGARGITICDRWRHSFLAFLADIGPRPSLSHSLDRIDNNGNYEPSNCRWATRREQNCNTRRSSYVDFNGERGLLIDLCEKFSISRKAVVCRLRIGWSLEEALNTPAFKPGGKRFPHATRGPRGPYGPRKRAIVHIPPVQLSLTL